MKSLIKAMDELPYWLKVVLCLPFADIVWSVYKICRSLDKKNVLGIVLGVLTIFPGAAFIWVIDIITVLVNKKVWWLD